MKRRIGQWAFFIGVVLATGSVFIPIPLSHNIILLILFALGFISGAFNVSQENTVQFLVGVIALTLFGIVGIQITSLIQTPFNNIINTMFINFSTFVISAGLVVSRKAIFGAAETPKIFDKIKNVFNGD